MTSDYLPTNCDESTDVGGVWICRLAVLPCPLFYGKEAICEKERAERFVEAMGELIRGAK